MNTPSKRTELALPKGLSVRNDKIRLDMLHNGVRFTQSFSMDKLGDAVQLIADIKAGRHTKKADLATGNWTVAEAVERYKAHRIKTTTSDNLKQFNWPLKMILEYFGPDTKLDSITEYDQEKFGDELHEVRGYSTTCSNTLCIIFARMLNYAHTRRGRASLARTIGKRKVKLQPIRFINYQEEDAIINWYNAFGYYDIAKLTAFYVDTGCRKMEAFKLLWRDISLERDTITLWETKTNKPRTVDMTKRVKAILAERKLNVDRKTDAWLDQSIWHSTIGIREYDAAIQKLRTELEVGPKLDPITKKVNRKYFCTHTYRHTFVTRLVASGTDLRTVMELAGHAEIKTTQRYSHFIPHKGKEAMAKLDRFQQQERQAELINLVPDLTLITGGR